MAITSTPANPYWQEKLGKAVLEQNRELVRQHVRDGNLSQLAKAMMLAMVDRSSTLDSLKALCKSYYIDIKEETWKMDKAAELKLLNDQKKALEKRIEKLEHGRWGKEPANGAMFKIEKSFFAGGDKFVYVALKAGGLWYLTGTGNDACKAYSWSSLQAFVGKYARVWRLTVAEELLD